MELYLLLLSTLSLVSIGTALECYACSSQDSNKEKCIRTTKQCKQEENICSAQIKWAIPPYWTPHGERIYYISKDCDVKSRCELRQLQGAKRCKRDWYNDWECTECCAGDLCNFYVTLDANVPRASILCVVPALAFLLKFIHGRLAAPL